MSVPGLTIPPLNVNQTPISGANQNGVIGTGDFFVPKQEDYPGAHNLLGGASLSTGGGTSLVLAVAGAIALYILLRKK